MVISRTTSKPRKELRALRSSGEGGRRQFPGRAPLLSGSLSGHEIGRIEMLPLSVHPMRSLLPAAFSLVALSYASGAENLLLNGSFEQPVVSERTSAGKGGDPGDSEESSWASLVADAAADGGKVTTGVTNELA